MILAARLWSTMPVPLLRGYGMIHNDSVWYDS